ncbi:hypothetical protein [Mucilaginibacter sp.]|uniref:hypothetical protein n=1 Tax=Mucilaginibacter sp. TaxID=1882438 RepID=UPI003D0EBC30
MSHNKQPERRTFLQDRLEILIKRQRAGKATFNELTELDSIVNADPAIRERIIIESFFPDKADHFNDPSNDQGLIDHPPAQKLQHHSLMNRLKALIKRIFITQMVTIKTKLLTLGTGNAVLV